MSSPSGVDAPGPGEAGRVRADLTEIEAAIDRVLATVDSEASEFSEAERIDRIAHLRRLRTKLAAAESGEVHRFARAHAASQTARGQVDPEKLQRSISAQVGLACRVSRHAGATMVRVGRDLRDGLDHVRALYTRGELSEAKVEVIVAATADLDRDETARVDRLLAGRDIVDGIGVGQLRDLVRSLAAQVAPEPFRARCRAARAGRRVSVRPAGDGMAYLTAVLPVEQAVACAAALEKAWTDAQVDPAPLTRGRGQVMADTLMQRVTGRATPDHVDLAVQVLVPLEVLIDPDSPLPVEIPGYGPVPADLLGTAKGRKTWKKLVTRAGVVIGGASVQRRFTGFLAELIRARDRRCREPYCDAPVRQTDHVRRVADGGPTTLDTGRGVCQFHNLLREQADWTVDVLDETIWTTTPTGHRYVSRPVPV